MLAGDGIKHGLVLRTGGLDCKQTGAEVGRIALRFRRETTMTLKSIAAQLTMNMWIHVSNRPAERKKPSSVNTKD
jgi:hypothetical protein